MMKLLRWLFGFVVLFYGLTGIYLGESALHQGRRAAEPQSMDQLREMAVTPADVQILGEDGTVLQGWCLQPARRNGDAILLLHGQASNRGGMLSYARLFLENGYDVLVPDSRAHGQSGGDLATYGLRESEDVHRWVSWLEANKKPRCVYALGESMGAAILLQSLQKESRFCAVVAECSFATFREIAYDRVGQHSGLGLWAGRTILRPSVEAGFLWARFRYGVNMDEVNPETAVEKTSTPILLIHGQKDRNIFPYHSQWIQQHNPQIQLWMPPQARHAGALTSDPIQFERRVLNWFQSKKEESE